MEDCQKPFIMNKIKPGVIPSFTKPIALIGFMGAGKSTVGRILADKLYIDFIDLDELIEKKTGKTINEIFSKEGEAGFRKIESEILLSISDTDTLILATGGGTPLQHSNRQFFSCRVHTFYLKLSFKTFWERTKGDCKRPLLKKNYLELMDLFNNRCPVYRELGICIDTDGKSPEAVADKLFNMLFE